MGLANSIIFNMVYHLHLFPYNIFKHKINLYRLWMEKWNINALSLLKKDVI